MTFGEAIQRKGNDKWIITMEELKLMQHNDNWELINLLEEFKAITCIRPKKKKKKRNPKGETVPTRQNLLLRIHTASTYW